MIPLPRTFPLLGAALLASLPGVLPAQESGSVAIRAGRILTAEGVLEDGLVVIRDGRIQEVGPAAEIEVPFDILLEEYPEGTLFAGFAEAHTSNGLDRANENVPVTPFLDVRDSLDPVSVFFEESLRQGVVALGVIPGPNTVIGGRGRVVRPWGMTVEAMTLAADMGMKIAFSPKSGWSRSSQLAELREAEAALVDALRRKGQELLDRKEEEALRKKVGLEVREPRPDGDDADEAGGFVRFGEDFPGKELIGEQDLDETQRDLVRILNGDLRLWCWCAEPTDVRNALTWLREHELLEHAVFVVQAPCWRVGAELAESGRPVVLHCDSRRGLWDVEVDPVTRKERRWFAPKQLLDAGVRILAVGSQPGRMGPDRLAYQAGVLVREGVDRSRALAAVTSAPAAAWGQEGRMGVIAPGAQGTCVLLDGDPLDLRSRVLKVWSLGLEIYDRQKDERLQRLLHGDAE